MKKRKATAILKILIFFILSIRCAGPADQDNIVPAMLFQKAGKMRMLLELKKSEGFDVSEAEKLDRLSKEEADKGNFGASFKLIDEAESLLGKVIKTPVRELTVTFPVDAKKVRITEAVPAFASGEEAANALNPFVYKTVDAKEGKVTVRLSEIPVYIEDAAKSGKQAVSSFQDSPFGIHEPPSDSYDVRLDELGVQWVRLSGPSGLVWDADEPVKGKYDWKRVDRCFSLFNKNKINMLVTVLCFNRWDRGSDIESRMGVPATKLPRNIPAYQAFLKKAVERFDGDGIDDAPGSPVVTYWQIENEPDGIGWGDSPQNFAKLVKLSYKAIKESNPSAKVMLGGIATSEGFYRFYIPMLEELEKLKDKSDEKFFDIIDFHWSLEAGGDYRSVKGYNMKEFLDDVRRKLDGYNYKNVPIWITEMSSYSGKPDKGTEISLPEKSEIQHACDMVKSYLYPLSLGVEKVFWTRLVEWHNYGNAGVNNYWDTVGLIHNPLNKGKSGKKLAYYAYKMMTEKLNGMKDISVLNIESGVYAYKFSGNGKDVYVLWTEKNQQKR